MESHQLSTILRLVDEYSTAIYEEIIKLILSSVSCWIVISHTADFVQREWQARRARIPSVKGRRVSTFRRTPLSRHRPRRSRNRWP